MDEGRSINEGVSMEIVRPDFTPRLLEAHARPMLPRTDGPIRVGILHNRKQNADVLIGRLAANLAHDLGGEVVFVGTTSFLPLARYETARRGVIDPRMVILDHPLGGVPADAIAQRADDARNAVAELIATAR